MKLTLTRGAILALACTAALQAAAQDPIRSNHGAANDAAVTTLTIDTRDTGVDLGRARGADASARPPAPQRASVEPPMDPRATLSSPTSGIVDAPASFAPTRPGGTVAPPRMPPLAPGRIDAATAAGAAARSRAQGGTPSPAAGSRATVVGTATADAAPR